ncbi:MAG: hypothetical protein AAGC67_11910 [Myxococcota bacterium]
MIDVLGGLCLVGALALTSFVHAVRADDVEEALMSVDPTLVSPPAAPAPAAPELSQPRVRPLNTRGYNYGPPPGAIDPAAMRQEAAMAPKPAPPASPTPR